MPVPGAWPARRSTRQVVFVAGVIAAVFVLPRLGAPPLHDWDEAWYAKIALDLQQSGHWWSYSYDDELESGARKPPLCFWIMMLAFRALGPTELAVRILSALSFITLVMVVAGFTARYLNASIALLASFLLAADPMLLFKHGARSGDMDAALMLLLTLTVLGMWPARNGLVPHANTVIAYAAAWWVKAFAALQVVPVIVAWLVLQRRWRTLLFACIWLGLGIASFVLYLSIRERYQPGILHDTIHYEFHDRMTGEATGGGDARFSYFRSMGRSMIPVLAVAGLLLIISRGRIRLGSQATDSRDVHPLLMLLLLWWLVPLTLFSLAGTHYDWYIYPTYVPAYMLLAWMIVAGLRSCPLHMQRCASIAVVVAMVFFASPSVWKLVHRSRSDMARTEDYKRIVSMLGSTREPHDVILYRPNPALRFELTRAGLAYRVANETSQLTNPSPGIEQILIGSESEPSIRERVVSEPAMQRRVVLPAIGYTMFQTGK